MPNLVQVQESLAAQESAASPKPRQAGLVQVRTSPELQLTEQDSPMEPTFQDCSLPPSALECLSLLDSAEWPLMAAVPREQAQVRAALPGQSLWKHCMCLCEAGFSPSQPHLP